jgi:predicted CoA-binding protein
MTDQAAIDDFLAEKKLAVVGVSQDKNKFGNVVYRRLKAHGLEVFAVNPKINVIEGDPCFPNLAALPEPVGGVVIVVPPEATKQVVIDAASSGIMRVWMQPGAESDEAVRFCEEHGIEVIHGLCIMTLSGS